MNKTEPSRLSAIPRSAVELLVILLAGIVLMVSSVLLLQPAVSENMNGSRHAQELAASLSRVLASQDGASVTQSLLQQWIASQPQPRPAYVTISSPTGEIILHSLPGKNMQSGEPYPERPAAWFGQRDSKQDGAAMTEIHAPVIRDGELLAFVSLAYAADGVLPSVDQLTALLLVLAIALLLPLLWRLFGHTTDHTPGEASLFAWSTREDAATQAGHDTESPSLEKCAQPAHTQTSAVVTSRLLQKQSDKLATMLDSMPCAVMVLDGDRRVSYANRRVYELFQVPRGTLLGSEVSAWCQHRAIREMLSSEQILRDTKCHHRRFDMGDGGNADNQQAMALELCPLQADNGFGKQAVMVMLTPVEAAFDAQRQLNDFIARVAHQIKSPLNTLCMYSEILGDADTSQRVRAAAVIQQYSRRMATMVDNLFHISMLDSGGIVVQPQSLDTQELLCGIIDEMKSEIPDRHRDIQLICPQPAPRLMADKLLIHQAIRQILLNALAYSEAGDRITLEVQDNAHDITLDISDSGPGIDDNEQQHIFDLFYRSEHERVRSVDGHGLGLPLAKRIMDSHGGQLMCFSQPGQGTRFSMVLAKNFDETDKVVQR